MSFGIMLHSGLCCSAWIWTYVVRDCVVQRNVYRLKVVWRNDVVRHNVVRRIVIWPTVGVSWQGLVSNNTDTLPRVISDYWNRGLIEQKWIACHQKSSLHKKAVSIITTENYVVNKNISITHVLAVAGIVWSNNLCTLLWNYEYLYKYGIMFDYLQINGQGWKFAHRFFKRIALVMWAKEWFACKKVQITLL